MIYFLSCIAVSKAKLEFELVKLCYSCYISLNNEPENVFVIVVKERRLWLEPDNTWYFIGCGQLQNGSGFMSLSFNILQGKDCFTLRSKETLEYIIKITKNKNLKPKPSNSPLSKVPSLSADSSTK